MYLKRTSYYVFISRLFNKHGTDCVCSNCGKEVVAVPYIAMMARLKKSRRTVDFYRADGVIPPHTIRHSRKIMYTRTQATLIAALIRAYTDAGRYRSAYPYRLTIKRVKLRILRKWYNECDCTLEDYNA